MHARHRFCCFLFSQRFALMQAFLLTMMAAPCFAQSDVTLSVVALSTLDAPPQATTSSDSWTLAQGEELPMQGRATTASTGAPRNTTTASTIALPGISTSMLALTYAGSMRQCLFVDNLSASEYFVPLRTYTELSAFANNAPPGTVITFGCPELAVSDPCASGSHVLPQGRNQSTISFASGQSRSLTYRCDASYARTPVVANQAAAPTFTGCGSWTLVADSGSCSPVVDTCATNPGLPGCQVDSCATNPGLPGCQADTCATNPSLPGCQVADACTASPGVCALYDRNLGRLPDQAGAGYWQGRWDILSAQGLTAAQIAAQLDHEMSGNAEAVNYARTGQVNQGLGILGSGTQNSPSCTGGTPCSASNAGAANSLWGWNSIGNVIATAYTVNNAALDAAGLAYWQGQYQAAVATGQTPEQAAQNVANAIASASGGNNTTYNYSTGQAGGAGNGNATTTAPQVTTSPTVVSPAPVATTTAPQVTTSPTVVSPAPVATTSPTADPYAPVSVPVDPPGLGGQ